MGFGGKEGERETQRKREADICLDSGENQKMVVYPAMLHLVAQLAGQRIGDQEVWGSIPDTGHE